MTLHSSSCNDDFIIIFATEIAKQYQLPDKFFSLEVNFSQWMY